jgi:hypothetical protein
VGIPKSVEKEEVLEYPSDFLTLKKSIMDLDKARQSRKLVARTSSKNPGYLGIPDSLIKLIVMIATMQ